MEEVKGVHCHFQSRLRMAKQLELAAEGRIGDADDGGDGDGDGSLCNCGRRKQ